MQEPEAVQREAQTCGRRMTELGPWEYAEGLDHWERDRWLTDEAEDQRRRAEYAAKYPGSSMASQMWRGPGAGPRTCSFCGGVHPDDALALIRLGWEVEPTTKSYKRYLQPPGSRARSDAILANMRSGKIGGEAFNGVPEVWAPVPPVKLYVQHFSPEQIEAFNTALMERKGLSPC